MHFMFDYHMKLHYSQTNAECTIRRIKFDYHREYPKVCVNLQTDVR